VKRRDTLAALAAGAGLGATLALPQLAAAQAARAGERVLRYAFQIAETGFDPPQLSDIYSRIVTGHIFEAFYTYDHLARPPKVVPLVATEMPEISDQFKLWTVKVRPGIFFADDPAFGGKKRELVAEDFAYTYKRFADPANKSPAWSVIEDAKIVGLDASLKLGAWRRSSRIELLRNPGYRERLWHAEPAADDAEGQAIVAKLKGRRLPLLDRVEISIIEESQPRWLSFLNGQSNFLERLPPDFVNVAMPGGKTAPNLAKRGIRGERVLTTDVVMTYFNMEDPVIGGYTPEKVALRRALSLSLDLDREIRLVRRGMAIPAQSPVVPYTTGYDPKFKSENSEYNPARANALLDVYGYLDRNGDGWREMPDGSPLVLQAATQPDQLSRQLNELWQKNFNAIGLKVEYRPAKWPENLKAARAGKLQMWGVASSAAGGDGQGILDRYYGPSAGLGNLARFKLPAMDKLYEQLTGLPDGPEREAVFLQAKRLAVAYVPYKLHCHRFIVDMMYGDVIGYRRPAYWQDWWHMVDVEPQPAGRAA